MTEHAQPYTSFEWPIYADATLAGLSVLVPVPLLDWFLEEQFRRRMPTAIARARSQRLPRPVLRALNASQRGCLVSGLLVLVKLPLELIKRLSKKILYFLAIKAATDQVSYYWQRAFLIDYALRSGHLHSVESTQRARNAMEHVLDATASPLTALAQRIIRSVRHVLPLLRRGRRGQEQDVLPQGCATMRQEWGAYEGFLRSLAARYNQAYAQQQ